jgi:hypothetical protein
MPAKPKPGDPATEAAARRIARRCVGIIEPLLQRPEEKGEAFREFYDVIHHELAHPPTEAPKA